MSLSIFYRFSWSCFSLSIAQCLSWNFASSFLKSSVVFLNLFSLQWSTKALLSSSLLPFSSISRVAIWSLTFWVWLSSWSLNSFWYWPSSWFRRAASLCRLCSRFASAWALIYEILVLTVFLIMILSVFPSH